MNTLQVHNSFQPYYAGRDTGTTRWTVRKKEGDKIDHVDVGPADEPEKSAKDTKPAG